MASLPTVPGRAQQQAALQAILDSGVIHRSSNMGQVLQYVCTMYFEGKSQEIKEYSIAVEALGRSPDFDKKRDSIVRVEAHRLRRRLNQYYQGPGIDDPIRIEMPEGSYVPTFRVRVREEIPARAAPADSVLEPMRPAIQLVGPEAAPERPGTSRRWMSWLLVAAGGLATGTAALVWTFSSPEPQTEVSGGPPATVTNPAAVPVEPAVRILAGRGQGMYEDRHGDTWQGDRFVEGGESAVARHQNVSGMDRNLFSSMRAGNEFTYRIAARPGTYELRLIFAETEYGSGNPLGGGETSRLFDVFLNGKKVLDTFDVIADAGGPNLATVKVFKDVRPMPDGKVHVRFAAKSGRAFVNAIALDAGTPGRLNPIRIAGHREAFRDNRDQEWKPDLHRVSGIQITRAQAPPAAIADPEVFRGEVYGNFAYRIPVPPGQYTLKLYFNEFWFGPKAPGQGGRGSRIFNVYCNHRVLLKDFDLFAEAGGSMIPVVKTFRSIEPANDGKLLLQFEPRINYAMINAIEVLDEGRQSP